MGSTCAKNFCSNEEQKEWNIIHKKEVYMLLYIYVYNECIVYKL